MRFLCRCDQGPGAAWRAAVADYATGAPGIVRELLLSQSVVCDPVEAAQVLAWAQAYPAGINAPALLYAHDPDATSRGVGSDVRPAR